MNIKPISTDEANQLINQPDKNILQLIQRANTIREQYFANNISTCAIINAKSGNCTENCKFCPQSIFATSQIEKYPLLTTEQITQKAKIAQQNQTAQFGIVTSGRQINNPKEQQTICQAITQIKKENKIAPCASLGIIDKQFLQQLKNAGLTSYHHNLETAETYYPQICTTRTYKHQTQTIKDAKEVGLKVCSGGLFGLGETPAQIIELFTTLRELQVDSIPINFLRPISGTNLPKNIPPLTPIHCLKIIAICRLMLPTTQIRICGGREYNLRDLQSWIFAAGANAMMVGSYLTTSGRSITDDLQMIKDAGMTLQTKHSCGTTTCQTKQH